MIGRYPVRRRFAVLRAAALTLRFYFYACCWLLAVASYTRICACPGSRRKNSRQYDLNVPTRGNHHPGFWALILPKYRVQLQRHMALDARQPVIIPATILLLIGVFFPPGQPALVTAAETPFP